MQPSANNIGPRSSTAAHMQAPPEYLNSLKDAKTKAIGGPNESKIGRNIRIPRFLRSMQQRSALPYSYPGQPKILISSK
jgi:hypothetical protein